MILQKEIDITIWFIITYIVLGIIFLILIIMCIYISIKQKIHSSYHKGYNQATNDNLRYYATLNTLIEKYNEIEILLKQDDYKFTLELSNKLNTFRQILKDSQEV